MGRLIQDIKLRAGAAPDVLWEMPVPGGATQETLVHDRMSDHFASKNGVDGVRVIDDESGDVLYQWTFTEEANARSARARKKLSETAQAELDRRQAKSTKLPRKLPEDPVSRAVAIMREATGERPAKKR